MLVIFTVLIVLAALLLNEIWWRVKKPSDEISRKSIHIFVGCFVAFWPYFLSWRQIELFGIAFFIVVFISKKVHVFKSIHSVQRPTYGELCFALAVTSVALLTHDKLIFMTAILTMGLADGLAAVIGSYFGKTTSYSIFGRTKSLVGSLTFYIVTLVLLAIYNTHTTSPEHGAVYLLIALAATAIENISVLGLDNLFVPLLITLCLR